MDKTKKKIAGAFLIAIFLAAFEGVVVSTAAPVIVKSLHNFELLSWIFSLYLLTSAISTPIYGKLADLYGRKRMLIIGIVIFLFGSTLCGLSQTMHQLVAFRAVQGLGAGAIMTIVFTMIGDIFTLDERSVVQGGVSTMWGIAGLVGPLLGGFLIDYLSWHWIFFINIPFGLLCIFILSRYVHEDVQAKKHRIDILGAMLLSAAIGTFLYAVMNIGENLLLSVNLLITSMITLMIFYLWEKRVAEPIVPLFILNKNSIIVNLITFGSSFILIANSVYLPLHIQSVMGHSATAAGIALTTTSLTWFGTSFFLARLMHRFPVRFIIMGASAVLFVCCLLLYNLTLESTIWQVAGYALIFGIGFSATLNTVTFIVQDSVEYENRGAAVGINMLTRTLAQTIGVAVLGAVINIFAAKYLAMQNLAGITMQDFYDNTYPQYFDILRQGLFFGLEHVYAIMAAMAVACFILGYFVPNYKK